MTAPWILKQIWDEGFEDGFVGPDAYWNVYASHCDESAEYIDGFNAGLRAKARSEAKAVAEGSN